jgi:ribose-phosphate pyrophosphokinase
MLMFNLDADDRFAASLAAHLDVELAPHEARVFEDGERKLRRLIEPRGDDA